MWEEPTSEEEDKVIERVARYIVNKRLEFPAGIILTGVTPFSFIGGQLGRFFLSPFLFAIGGSGEGGYRFIATFEKRSNVKKLQERIEELREVYELAEKKLMEERDRSAPRKKGRGMGERLKRFLFGRSSK